MTSPFVGDQRPPGESRAGPGAGRFPAAAALLGRSVRSPAALPGRAARHAAGVRPAGYPAPTDGSRPAYAMRIPPIAVVPAPVSALPTEPVPYHQMLRGPRYRWWKPIVTLLLAVALGIPLLMLSFIPLVVMGLVTGAEDLGLSDLDVNDLSPTAFVVVNLSLIVLIPLAGLTIWIVHRVRPRYLSSVAGGIRWRWLLRCALVVLPLWLIYLVLGFVVAPPASSRPDDWLVLLVIVLVMTPFQAAGEEYFFRGWLMQNIGAWFARPMVGLVVSVAVSTVAFAAAHGSPDPWILASIGCLAVASGIAAYRTGGLEAGIAMHAVNNLLAFGAVLTFGGWEEAFVGADTSGTPAVLLFALLVHGGALALILWQAKRHGIQSHYQPQPICAPGLSGRFASSGRTSARSDGSAGQRPADGAQRGPGERAGDQPVGGRQGRQQQHRPRPGRQDRDRPGGQQGVAQLLRSGQRRVLEQQVGRLRRRRGQLQLGPVVGHQAVDLGHGLRCVDHPELLGDETGLSDVVVGLGRVSGAEPKTW